MFHVMLNHWASPVQEAPPPSGPQRPAACLRSNKLVKKLEVEVVALRLPTCGECDTRRASTAGLNFAPKMPLDVAKAPEKLSAAIGRNCVHFISARLVSKTL